MVEYNCRLGEIDQAHKNLHQAESILPSLSVKLFCDRMRLVLRRHEIAQKSGCSEQHDMSLHELFDWYVQDPTPHSHRHIETLQEYGLSMISMPLSLSLPGSSDSVNYQPLYFSFMFSHLQEVMFEAVKGRLR
jgi:hypothetical protein